MRPAPSEPLWYKSVAAPMRLRTYVLAAIGATVVVGGIYLWLDVRQASESVRPSASAVAEAQARHVRAGMRADNERLGRRPERAEIVEPDPSMRFPETPGLPRPRPDVPGIAADGPPALELADRLRSAGAIQPAIDPDNPELASAMTETNKAYDRGDFEGARALAMKLLGKDPTNVRMLRVVVSSSCIMGDAELATQYWAKLPPTDQAAMTARCTRYQVTFPPPTPPTEK